MNIGFIKNKNVFFRLLANIIAYSLLLFGLAFAVWTIFYTETGNGDNAEHIHATWLIAYGKIPYRDFFEHHNPLLWYLFAPFLKLFTNQIIILDSAHALGLLCGVCTFVITYKISKRFFASRFPTILSILTLCPPYFFIYCFNFNPDTFMALTFAFGLYYLFIYWQEGKLFQLVLSFLTFFIAFLFTQKVLMILGFLGGISLYVFINKKTPINHIIYALLLPILGLFTFLAYWYHYDALEVYLKSNFLFNIKMQDYYGTSKISVMDWETLRFSILLSIISIICFIKSAKIYYRVVALLFIIELLVRAFYFSIAPYYMLPLMIFMVCLNSLLLEKIIQKWYISAYIVLGIAIFYASISKNKYLSARGQNRSFIYYLNANTTPCDYLISGFFATQNIIGKNIDYYWAMLGHVDIVGEEVGLAPKPNLDELILKYKPKLIYGGNYFNSYDYHRGKNVLVYKVSPQIIDKYYLPTPFSDFYLLKYEYHHKKCIYNKDKNDWQYLD